MISLPYLVQLNNRKAVRNDNFNRDSSFVRSRGSYVIHSGIHRSTAYLTSEGIPAFDYWSKQGQAAVNGFIEATIDGASLEDCELNALSRKWPNWKFSATKYRGNVFTAIIPGKLETRVSATDWRLLNDKLG